MLFNDFQCYLINIIQCISLYTNVYTCIYRRIEYIYRYIPKYNIDILCYTLIFIRIMYHIDTYTYF